MTFPHGFCPNCGTSVYARALHGEYKDIMAVNVGSTYTKVLVFRWFTEEQGRTLKDVDLSTLKIEQLNGKRINAG